jgi:hypothetical protein
MSRLKEAMGIAELSDSSGSTHGHFTVSISWRDRRPTCSQRMRGQQKVELIVPSHACFWYISAKDLRTMSSQLGPSTVDERVANRPGDAGVAEQAGGFSCADGSCVLGVQKGKGRTTLI